MKLCIAEKPSVARDIAKVLGATTPKQGYMEGNGYCVTWTFGHLLYPERTTRLRSTVQIHRTFFTADYSQQFWNQADP